MINRALVVALGSIGKRHLRLLREELPHSDIRVLRSTGCTQQAIPGANGCFDSLQDALEFSPDIAIVASPAPFHLTTSLPLAQSGVHLLIEKPISNNIEGVHELLDVCYTNKQVIQVGYNLRLLNTLQRFRDEINQGAIGEVLSVRCEIGQYLPTWRPDSDYRKGVSARSDMGGGALLELSHELDMLRWVFGEVSWVSAWMDHLSNLDINVEDCVMLQLGFINGAAGQASMDLLRHDTTRTCTAIGAKGSLRWDAIAGTVAHFNMGKNRWQVLYTDQPERDYSYRKQIKRFIAAVSSKSQDTITANGSDGLAVMNIVEAARASSMKNGVRVNVNGVTK